MSELLTPPALETIQGERPYLLRFALMQLRDSTLAEDAVQETLLAAIEGRERFSGRSSLRTWLTGILKHKIIDHLRRSRRETPLQSQDDERSEADAIDALFVGDGHWRDAPANWGNPDTALENSRFREALAQCLQQLPARTAQVFTMREVMDMDTDEICKEIGISTTNCWVMLHRARLTLRECLDQTWFGSKQ